MLVPMKTKQKAILKLGHPEICSVILASFLMWLERPESTLHFHFLDFQPSWTFTLLILPCQIKNYKIQLELSLSKRIPHLFLNRFFLIYSNAVHGSVLCILYSSITHTHHHCLRGFQIFFRTSCVHIYLTVGNIAQTLREELFSLLWLLNSLRFRSSCLQVENGCFNFRIAPFESAYHHPVTSESYITLLFTQLSTGYNFQKRPLPNAKEHPGKVNPVWFSGFQINFTRDIW